jgi:hypothetical protein
MPARSKIAFRGDVQVSGLQESSNGFENAPKSSGDANLAEVPHGNL